MAEETEERQYTIADLLSVAKRRLWWILIPALVGPVVAYVIATFLPPVFTSQAFVLVDQPVALDALVQSKMTDQLQARVATIDEQLVSRSNLESLIQRLNLYPQLRKKATMDDLVALLKKQIKITPIRGESSNTIAGFYIAVSADDAQVAQKICSGVLSIFMSESVKAGTDSAQDTAQFLTTQLNDAKQRLDQSNAKLLAFKSSHLGELPADQQSNLQELSTLRSRMIAIRQEISQAQEQKATQETSLAQLIANEKSARTTVVTPNDVKRQLTTAQNELSELEARYTPEHPDVVKKRAQIESLQHQLALESSVVSSDAGMPDSPEIAQIRASIRAKDEIVRARRAEEARLEQQSTGLERRLQVSPLIEEEFKPINREYEDALQAYNDLNGKKTQSSIVKDLEQQRVGAQFHVMDAPSLPLVPSGPIKIRFVGIGLLIGFSLGVILSWIVETRNRCVWTVQDVEHYLDLPILAEVPVFKRG